MTPPRTPLRLTIYAWALTGLFFIVIGALGFDSGQYLRRLFFALRGVREVSLPLHLVVLQDSDFDSPLSLSKKYPLSDLQFEELLSRIRTGEALQIFIDESLQPASTLKVSAESGRAPNQGTYRTVVKAVSVPTLQTLLLPSSGDKVMQASADHPESAPLLLQNGVAAVLPEQSAIYSGTLMTAENSFPNPTQGFHQYINFYGPAGTLPRSSFSKVLTTSQPDLSAIFSGKDVFIGRESTLFLKGQIPSNRYAAAIGGEEFIDTELFATMRANKLDGSYIVGRPSYVLFISLFGITVLGIVFIRAPYRYASSGLLVVFVSSVIALYQLFLKSLWITGSELLLIYPLILIAVVSVTTIRRSWEEERETRSFFHLN